MKERDRCEDTKDFVEYKRGDPWHGDGTRCQWPFGTIRQLLPAAPGWRSVWRDREGVLFLSEEEITMWALTELCDGSTIIRGHDMAGDGMAEETGSNHNGYAAPGETIEMVRDRS